MEFDKKEGVGMQAGKALGCAISLLVAGLLCGIVSTTSDPQLGGFEGIAVLFFVPAIIFFIIFLVKIAVQAASNTSQTHEAAPRQPSQQQQPAAPPQSRARSGVFLPQALPDQGKNKPRQEGR